MVNKVTSRIERAKTQALDNILKRLEDPDTNATAFAALLKRLEALEDTSQSDLISLTRAQIRAELAACAAALGRKGL